jgi:hypothetical protein
VRQFKKQVMAINASFLDGCNIWQMTHMKRASPFSCSNYAYYTFAWTIVARS